MQRKNFYPFAEMLLFYNLRVFNLTGEYQIVLCGELFPLLRLWKYIVLN
jgi:hypothetical protein